MFKFQKAKCTQETMGIVTKKSRNDGVIFLTAEYMADGVAYKRKEQLRY